MAQIKNPPLDEQVACFPLVGVETEYGFVVQNGQNSADVLERFFDFIYQTSEGSPTLAPSQITYDARDLAAIEVNTVVPSAFKLHIPNAIEPRSLMLPNGARFYLDHGHPEYCTPECESAKELLLYDLAGQYFLKTALARYNNECAVEDRISLYKNNSDHHGHSYGCHENYLMPMHTYTQLFNSGAHRLYAYLIPYLVTRQVFCGAGKVGSEIHGVETDYQISQRADFFETIIGLQTTYARPLINTRDEAHADRSRFRRLHIIIGDANLAELSTYLKIGVTQLVLAMLQADALRIDIILANPLNAFKSISCDPDLKTKVELEYGQRYYTALEIQKVFLEAARTYLDTSPTAHHRFDEIWQRWNRVVYQLENKREDLYTQLDWLIKFNFLHRLTNRKNMPWNHPMLRELDFKYHSLEESESVYSLLYRNKNLQTLVNPELVLTAQNQPPATTRAKIRGEVVKRFGQKAKVGWDRVYIERQEETPGFEIPFPDPTCTTYEIPIMLYQP